jgi:oxygen-dependent protoporphyrinogen oxidase
MTETDGPVRASVAVIGAGIAGLATALHLRDGAREAGHEIGLTVFEKSREPGGNLRTLERDGWRIEWGPNGFLDNEPATLRLVARLGLDDDLERSSDAARRRFLLLDGQLQEIPTSPPAFLRSSLLPIRAKLRMAGELFVPARKDLGRAAEEPATDETVAAFGTRRLGSMFTEILLDPMVKGIFGGDARALSLAAAFPRMVELERDYGGLLRAMIALARKRKRTDAGPSGVLHSFGGGMATLVQSLAAELAADSAVTLEGAAEVHRVGPVRGGWEVTTADRGYGPFTAVVDAAPAHAAADHVRDHAPALGELLAGIAYVPMAVIALGYARDAVTHDLDGFGLLIPSRERRNLLGALWTSSIFSARAPADRVLIRCMAGGASDPKLIRRDDQELTDLAIAELKPLLGLTGQPELAHVIRHERAIAQYVPGHLARLRRIEGEIAHRRGLFLTGSSYRGISVNACVKQAEICARDVLRCLVASGSSSDRTS